MKNTTRIILATVWLAFSSFHAGAQWSAFGTGATTGYIMNLLRHNNEIYANGSITQIGGIAVNKAAKWNGTSWQAVGNMGPDIHRLSSMNGDLYAAPYSTAADSNYLYKLNGQQWDTIKPGFYLTNTNTGQYHNCSLYDVIPYQGTMVAAGEFDMAGSNPVNGIALWTGTEWVALGTGLTEPMSGLNIYPHQLFYYKAELYVVGNFKKAGGATVNGVAKWDGVQWNAMGAGFDAVVYGIEAYNDELYVSGEFTKSGSTALGCVAKWDGSNWVNPGISVSSTKIGYKAFGHTLKVLNDKLYLSGGFDKCIDGNAQTIIGKNVLEFDGSRWNSLDGGTNGDAEGLIDYNNGVLLGGGFSIAGTANVNSLALWRPFTFSVSKINALPVSVYPNPVTNQLHIDMPRQVATIQIVNAIGQQVYYNSAFTKGNAINTSAFAAGTYFVRLTDTDGMTGMAKFLK